MSDSSVDCEPMDIDLSLNSIASFSFNSSTFPEVQTQSISPEKKPEKDIVPKKEKATISDYVLPDSGESKTEWTIKKFHLKKEPLTKKHTHVEAKYTFALITFCCLLIGYYTTHISCIEELQLDQIEKALATKLYGQNIAIDQIIEILKVKTESKIIFFYGGTGVGKTYTTSLILKDNWNYSNIYHFTMPSFENTFSTNLLSGLILCKSAVMVVDNLSHNDMKISTLIKEVIEKSIDLGKNLTIFLIYNCDTVSEGFVRKCDSSFLNKLQESYKELKALKAFVQFKTLTEDVLRRCIASEIGQGRLNEAQMVKILKNFDVSSDGCKGVQTKMKFLNIL